MAFPDYTVAECETAIAAIDAQLVKLRSVASSFSVGSKAFDFRGKREALLDERATWVTRWEALTGRDGGGGIQGPRLVPSGG